MRFGLAVLLVLFLLWVFDGVRVLDYSRLRLRLLLCSLCFCFASVFRIGFAYASKLFYCL